MFPKFTEYVADEQPKSRLAEAERNRLAKAFQPEQRDQVLVTIKQPIAIRVLKFVLNLV
jgi:hypothetical protein